MYKLAVSPTLTFKVRLAVGDGDQERTYTARVQADRLDDGNLDKAVKETPVYVDFLAKRNLKLLGWDGEGAAACPLVDDNGQPAPATPDALQALLGFNGAAYTFFLAYAEATSIKAKQGN